MTHNTKTLHDSIPALVIVNSFAILINTLAIIYTFIENDDSRSYPVLVESDKSEESTKDVTEDEASQSGIAKEKAEMNIDNMTLGQLYAESSYYNYDILLYSPRFNGDEDALNKYLDEIDDKIDELEDAKSAKKKKSSGTTESGLPKSGPPKLLGPPKGFKPPKGSGPPKR